VSLDLTDDKMCFVCGKENALGLHLEFQHPADGRLTSRARFAKEHQGYKDIVHGGIMATVLDEMMVNLAWVEKKPCVTAEITVRLKRPVPVGEEIVFESRVDKEEGRLLFTSAEARNASGEILASATAKCLRVHSTTGYNP
jgi:acyl-coenzyme A thioesterase PaaI-like protein